MKISLKEIFAFHTVRTQCHVDVLNYFAEILGYHFPEHDNDKNQEPIRTGYAFCNYARYHKGFVLLPEYEELFQRVRTEHHNRQPHHLNYYSIPQDIPKITLIEMVCDWHSANFEQRFILQDKGFDSVMDFYEQKILELGWDAAQRDFIVSLIIRLSDAQNNQDVMDIWKPTLQLSDL